MGPVISAAARERIDAQIAEACSDGIRQVAGGPRSSQTRTSSTPGRGYYVQPAVFSEVGAEAAIAQREIFGPVLAIQPYGDDEEAVAIANATPYGLSAELWSGDPARAGAVARLLRCGQVKINGVRTRDTLAAPFGGYGQSGVGRELGRFGIEEFCEVKAVLGA